MTLATYLLSAPQANEELTSRDQCIDILVKNETPRSDTVVSAGHEKFSYRLDTRNPVLYDEVNGLKDFMVALGDFGWRTQPPFLEASRGMARITLGMGGQIAFHGSSHKTLHEVASEIDQHITEICDIGQRLQIGFLGLGYHPTAHPDATTDRVGVPLQNLQNYLKDHFPLEAELACYAASNWTQLQYSSQEDWRKKFRIALALEPIVTALFAASPIKISQAHALVSTRQHIRSLADQGQRNNFNFVFQDNFSYADYVDAALNTPMRFIVRDDTIVDCRHLRFRDFIDRGQQPKIAAHPTMQDWFLHLNSFHANTNTWDRLRLFAADSSSTEMALALPSFWTGLLYDETSLNAAWSMIDGWTIEDHWQLHEEAPRHGLHSQLRGQTIGTVAEDVLTLAKQGLRRRAQRLHGGADEARYLEILFNILDSQQTVADQIVMQRDHFKDFTMETLFETHRFKPPVKTNEGL